MKKIILVVFISVFILSCSSDDGRSNNPNLPSIGFNHTVNLDLPQFNSLKFPGNFELIRIEGVGIKGVVIYNIDNTLYSAFELSDPNIIPSSCSALSVTGIRAESNCGNDNAYEIINGQQLEGEGGFPLLRYQIRRDGNILVVSN
ncbi:hypothetical protein SAMN04487910_1442 [Aquimarina amphilecti]|uniref:Ferredoxin subunit of nitrite reductase or a ring-hydroxylating dioxygenase n=1 Tax=Aquimarina amphilecti TaxID=1038014 RepID=A0A1H7KVD4_AQUAM|nr:hypothetical protein [Aquimarina amphilecti]SEK90718.1 hypothetical protein SAMN04487910_1442 [Aquimarina amphilecti]